MKLLLGLFTSLFCVASFSAEPKVDLKALKAAFSQELKDADSAKFADITVKREDPTKDLWMVCGKVNAKNGFGGYAGFQPFLAFGITSDPTKPVTQFPIVTVGDVAASRCDSPASVRP